MEAAEKKPDLNSAGITELHFQLQGVLFAFRTSFKTAKTKDYMNPLPLSPSKPWICTLSNTEDSSSEENWRKRTANNYTSVVLDLFKLSNIQSLLHLTTNMRWLALHCGQ